MVWSPLGSAPPNGEGWKVGEGGGFVWGGVFFLGRRLSNREVFCACLIRVDLVFEPFVVVAVSSFCIFVGLPQNLHVWLFLWGIPEWDARHSWHAR